MSELLNTLKRINDPDCPLTVKNLYELLQKAILHIEKLEEIIESNLKKMCISEERCGHCAQCHEEGYIKITE